LNESERQTIEDLNEKQSELSLTIKEAVEHIEEAPYGFVTG
jgi:RNA polymerase-binding transcription factor DksA